MKAYKLPPVQAPRFTRMNLDVDVRGLQSGEYRRLLNGITIGPFGQSAWDGIVNNIVGDEKVTNAALQATSTVIGFLEDVANNRCFFIVYHSGNNHTVYQYTTAAGIATVIRTSVFGFAATDFISADIIGDLLVLTNNSGEIRQINVSKALAGTHYVTPTKETISLIKKGPSLPVTLSEVAGTGRYSYSGYQFYFRYIYEDGQPSVWGSLSKIYSTKTPNTTQATILRITVQSETVPDTVLRKEFAFRLAKSNEFVIYRTENAGSFSATHDFTDELVGETIPDSDSFKWFESIPKASKAIKWMKNRLFTFNNLIGYDRPSTIDYSGVLSTLATVPNPSYPGSSSDLYTNPDDYYAFKSSSKFKMGILFTDWAGRHIGCLSDPNMVVTIPDFNFTNWVGYRIAWNLTGKPNTNIPTWATHWQWVRTKSLTRSFFLQSLAPDVFYYKKDVDGAYVFSKTVIPDVEGVAIDLSNLTKNNIGYTLNVGDFIRLYTSTSTFVFDKKIEFQDGKFIFIKGSASSVTLSAAAPDIFYYEIYTPYPGPLTETFYEIGEKYAISSPGTGGRAYGTLTGTLRGDCFMKQRTAAAYNAAGYSATAPYANVFNTFNTLINHQAMNPSDDFFTDWIQDTGRATIDTPSVKEVRLTTNLRYGRPYTNVASTPQFNVFDALDDQQLPIESGAGTGLAEAGEVLVAIHEAAATSVYVGQGFVNTSDGNNFLTKTDNVIGDFRKYMERSGSVHPSTIVAKNGRVYWLDIRNGYVVRRSQDGLTPISVYGMRTEFAYYCRIYRDVLSSGNQRIVAGWDPKYRCYVLSFQNLSVDPTLQPARTFYFHEDSNSWVGTNILYPEFFGQLNDLQFHFYTGDLWRQTNNSNFNNWFGVQAYRSIDIEVGGDSEEKIWTGIEVDIDSIYTPATPATLLKLLAPSSWVDASLASPVPTYGATTIDADAGSFGLIKGYQALIIPPSAMVRVNYKVTISNLKRVVEMFANTTPGDWSEVDSGTSWSVVGDSIEVTMSTVSNTKKRQLVVNIPAGSYTAYYNGEVVQSGFEVGNLYFKYYHNGSEIASKIINAPPSATINIAEAIVFAQSVDMIEIIAEDTSSLVGDVYFRVDDIRLRRLDNVTSDVELPAISTILATALGASIETESTSIIHPGAGSKDYVISHELANSSVGNSARLYIQTGSLSSPEYFYDILFTLPVGAVLYQTLPSNEDVVLLYQKVGASLQTRINVRDFHQRASAWWSSFFRYISDPNFSSGTESKYKSSQKVRGQSAYITINARDTGANPMKSITVFYEQSMLSYQ